MAADSPSSKFSRQLHAAADWAGNVFEDEGIKLTLGGEPTYVPIEPEGAEWSHSAVGPTKLGYAREMALRLLAGRMKGGACFFSPGKQYPGEVNPRWALRLVARRDGKALFRAKPTKLPVDVPGANKVMTAVRTGLGVSGKWIALKDSRKPPVRAWALPIDFEDGEWVAVDWKLKPEDRMLNAADGPAGLRLPLHAVPVDVPRRAVVVELNKGRLHVFFPPVVQDGFSKLVKIVGAALSGARVGNYELQGYVPPDEGLEWTVLGLTADPGVLEVNIPACASWADYDSWLGELTTVAEAVGLRSWKAPDGDYEGGTGGGNHLLWGGPSVEENPFFSRPGWLASIARYWQAHPALAYVFTGTYVGASSQAPRPDESAKALFDLEMGYRFLESLPEGDHRSLINETLRHLHTDVTGNAHRSELSLDKFWNPGWPGGTLGLLEFRAVESLPTAEWMSAVALLWTCLAALNAKRPLRGELRAWNGEIHDRYFLPSLMWADLEAVLDDLASEGCRLPKPLYRAVWEWRFTRLLKVKRAEGTLEIRRAHESWPLLCETPVEGGSTSRFVDTSMHRFEVRADSGFAQAYEIRFLGRKLPLATVGDGAAVAGLRYRRSCLYPCLHPGIEPHLPLDLAIVRKADGETAATYELGAGGTVFLRSKAVDRDDWGADCRPIGLGALTCDLRLD